MSFLNPSALVGLVAAIVPLAIHLLQRGHTRPVPFSNLLFLRRLDQSRMRRVRLRQWLILLLRTLIVALVVSAFARPVYRTEGSRGGYAGPTLSVVLLDLSYSTRYRLPEGSLFDQLQRQALELLELFDRRDQAIFIPFASQPQPLGLDNADRQQLEARIRELAPSEEATDLRTALQAAARYLTARPELARELFLLTDLARHNWSELDDQRPWLEDTRVYITLPDISERGNLYLDEVRLLSWMPAMGKKLDLQVRLANSSAQSMPSTSLDLYLDAERVSHREVDLRPGEEVQVDFAVAPRRTGRLTGYVELEDDPLPLDNRRYFVVDVPVHIGVWVLGDQLADTYYVRRALAAAAAADPVLEVRSGLFADLSPDLLEGIDVLVLCNLQRLTLAQVAFVRNFVAAGGGVVLFPAPRADLSFYNRDLLPELLPVLVRGVVGEPSQQRIFQVFDQEAPHHPLFQELLADREADQPHFFALFDLVPRGELQPLIQFTGGRPALVSSEKGEGRIVLVAVPLSLEWTDLPLRGLFVPLMHRLVRELSLPADRHSTYLVGQSAYRQLKGVSLTSPVQAESPSGARLLLEPELARGQIRWKIARLAEAGLWRLWLQERLVDQFPVNVDTRESVLTPISRERLLQVFGAERTYFLRPDKDLRSQVWSNRYGRELWREFLLLALVLLVLELWLARAPQGVRESIAKSESSRWPDPKQ